MQKLEEQYNEENVNRIIGGYTTNRKTTFRVNTLKASIEEIKKVLSIKNIDYENIAWYDDAFILNNATEKEIKQLKIFEEGKIYLQSLSSMIPVLVLNPQHSDNVLDMCAAPGGKTTQMSAVSNNTCLITACEKNKIRAERLQYNIQKQGATKITVLKEDARKLNEYFSFDKILLDSPCSGSGTLSLEDNQLDKYFSEDLLNNSIKTQKVLLKKAIQLLKHGHEMVYSTCSILKDENEIQIKKVLKEQSVEVVPIEYNFLSQLPLLPSSIDGAITVCPTEYYEGFFIVKLKKL